MEQPSLEHIVELLQQRMSSLQAVYLYGSFASELIHDQSDIDLAFLLPPSNRLPFDTILDIQIELEKLLGRSVDLIDMRSATSVLQFEILNTGQRIFVSDAFEVDLYEMLAIALFQKLVDERREIIEEGLKTGFYHL